MIIGGLQKTTLIDYPGKIAATIFLLGCNFKCPWCYSRELVLQKEIENHPKLPEEYIFDFLKEKKGMLDGVVICGGEPTLQKKLPDFCRKIKKLGFFIKLDTNGSNPEMLKELIKKELVDYIAMDIKAPFSGKKYNKAVGLKSDLKKIKESVGVVRNSGIDFEFRTTIVPEIHELKDIEKIAKDLSAIFGKESKKIKYFLQNFRPEKTVDDSLKNKRPYSDEIMEEMKMACKKFIENCEIRG